MGSVDEDSPQPPFGKTTGRRLTANGLKKKSGQQQQQQQQINNNYGASNNDKERLLNVRAKLWSNGQSWHLTRVCNMSTVRREWMAVQEVSSIPFADLVLDARNNNDITTSNATTAKKQKKERQNRQYQPSWEIPKDLSDAMKLKGKSDQSQLKIATTTTLTKRKSARTNSRTTWNR